MHERSDQSKPWWETEVSIKLFCPHVLCLAGIALKLNIAWLLEYFCFVLFHNRSYSNFCELWPCNLSVFFLSLSVDRFNNLDFCYLFLDSSNWFKSRSFKSVITILCKSRVISRMESEKVHHHQCYIIACTYSWAKDLYEKYSDWKTSLANAGKSNLIYM